MDANTNNKNDEHSIRMYNTHQSNESDLHDSKNSMPTIYPNDYDFNAISGFGFNSTTSRSFVRPSKQIGQEHRNISVPNSLKVPFYSYHLFPHDNWHGLFWHVPNEHEHYRIKKKGIHFGPYTVIDIPTLHIIIVTSYSGME